VLSSVTRRLKKFAQFFKKVAKTIAQPKNAYIKAQFESQKHVKLTAVENLKYLQQTMFENCLFRVKK
jgi:hypothetical protein